jgi:FlaA1/EpsC-like NDP-sugar epimerase
MPLEISFNEVIGRKPIVSFLDVADENALTGQRILLTGAGGSIGSKIGLYISKFKNVELLATDRDENRLHSLSLELMGSALFNSSTFRILDVRDLSGIVNIFKDYKPTMVIHAAALKHLAILEKQPREAYLTNVIGTDNLLKIASAEKVSRFLNISTDKAANPVSVLGKSKYIGELLTAKYREIGNLGFTNVRFGNVFNSKGSVIETFAHQIKKGIPITLTHKEVTRFFMQIEEAASLSISASILNAGEVHILNMGDPVLLVDIIHRMQKILKGSSEIQIVGLREGEKLFEELWSKNETVHTTAHPAIKAISLNKKFQELPNLKQLIDNDQEALSAINNLISII